jgi:osmotically-inducible protein OsmY
MRIGSMIKGGLVGAAVAYLFDPVSGNGRRARLRDQVGASVRRAQDRADKLSRHTSNVIEGKKAELAGDGDRSMDDATVADRIRSEVLGRPGLDAGGLVVDVQDGVAHLRGEMQDEARITEVVAMTRSVAGVRDVENLIHVPGTPAPNKQAARSTSRSTSTRTSTGSSTG